MLTIHFLHRPLRAALLVFLGLTPLGFLTGCASTGTDDGIKLLVIGNSFTNNTLTYLPRFASNDGEKLVIFSAAIGGSYLETHAAAANAYAINPENPAGRIYRQGQQRFSLVEALKSRKWDYVTIQESLGRASRRDASTEQLQVLVDLVRLCAPQAQILLFEPWSAMEDQSPVPDGRTSSQIAYERIHAETLRLAARFNLKVLPVGTAFQNARNNPLWQIKNPDPDFDYKNAVPGQLPDQTGNLINGWSWSRGSATEQPRMIVDRIHANAAGSYLAGAVLYEMISGSDIRKNSLLINGLTARRDKSIRAIAHAAVVEIQDFNASLAQPSAAQPPAAPSVPASPPPASAGPAALDPAPAK